MVRKLILAAVILAMTAVPVPALAGDRHEDRREFRGGHERFERHERFEHGPFIGFFPTPYYPAPYYAYAPPVCYWQPGYWVNQPYVDAWGRFTYVQQWVPAQQVCQ
jgi:hypothetical protein